MPSQLTTRGFETNRSKYCRQNEGAGQQTEGRVSMKDQMNRREYAPSQLLLKHIRARGRCPRGWNCHTELSETQSHLCRRRYWRGLLTNASNLRVRALMVERVSDAVSISSCASKISRHFGSSLLNPSQQALPKYQTLVAAIIKENATYNLLMGHQFVVAPNDDSQENSAGICSKLSVSIHARGFVSKE